MNLFLKFSTNASGVSINLTNKLMLTLQKKKALFSRWCKYQKAGTKEDLTQLILLEEFKNSLPDFICTHK